MCAAMSYACVNRNTSPVTTFKVFVLLQTHFSDYPPALVDRRKQVAMNEGWAVVRSCLPLLQDQRSVNLAHDE